MELLANDLSIHEQFHDIAAFRDALVRLVSMRDAARRSGREVYCHHARLTARPMAGVQMQQAVGRLADRNERRAGMVWLTQTCRVWDDLRQHGTDDWMEYRGDVVTDTVIGEAAFRTLHSVECGLISVAPSNLDFSPVEVIWRPEAEELGEKTAAIENWRDPISLEEGLRNAAPPIQSWDDLCQASTNGFEGLTIVENCFKPLDGVPFPRSSAERILVLLDTLVDGIQHMVPIRSRIPVARQEEARRRCLCIVEGFRRTEGPG